MADSIDVELLSLVNKLNKIQRELGGGKNKNDKDKSGFLGTGGDKVDRFTDIEMKMEERIETLKSSIDEIQKLERVPGSNPKELITLQSTVRTELSTLGDEWKEIDMIQRIESKKKRSRFTPEEIQRRQQVVIETQNIINNLKDLQRSGYVKQYQGYKLVSMEESELFKKRDVETGETKVDKDGNVTKVTSQAKGVTGKRNANMTDQHRQQLMLIKERDEKIDLEIEEIGKGVDTLHEIARQANEEIKVQNRMLDVLEEKVNDISEGVSNVNEKLKVTLDKARASDKICMDIICIIILVGLIIVLIQLNNKNAKK
eukprot:gene4544-4872_t